MQFDFNYKLQDGATLVIDAEVTEDDTIIVGVSCPNGGLSSGRMLDGSLRFEAIEARAREEYGELCREIINGRNAAGVAGERAG